MKKDLQLMVGMIGLYVGSALALDQYGQQAPNQPNYDAIVVLGCRVQADGTPSLALAARTRKAVELYNQGYAPKIILTGGVGLHKPAESVAAFEYATTELGVPEDVFVLEKSSTSTQENAYYAASAFGKDKSVLIVSDAYHVFRSERVFERYFEEVDGAGRVPILSERLKGSLREVAAVLYYWLEGRI